MDDNETSVFSFYPMYLMILDESSHIALMGCHVYLKNDETNQQIEATDLQLGGILFGIHLLH